MKEIVSIIEKASQSLEKSLSEYWPVINPDKNGLQEINLTVHVAAKAIESGMLVYPEASHDTDSNNHKRIDLLAKGNIEEKQSFILFESKKLYSSEKAHEMVSDLDKMKGFKLINSEVFSELEHPEISKYYVLLALTVRKDIKDWWESTEDYPEYNNSWDELASVLTDKAIDKGAFKADGMQPQFVLYAVFKVND